MTANDIMKHDVATSRPNDRSATMFTIMPGRERELVPVVDSRRFVVGVPSDRVRERFCASDGTSHPARLEGLRILIVDDSADARTLTSSMLTQAGASVRAVASVKEALQMLELERPDALVSEIGLPDRDGYWLIRQIRQDEAEHGGFLPALALTGCDRAEDRAQVLAAGFQAHVSKPVEPLELITALAAMTQYLRNSANGARGVGPRSGACGIRDGQ